MAPSRPPRPVVAKALCYKAAGFQFGTGASKKDGSSEEVLLLYFELQSRETKFIVCSAVVFGKWKLLESCLLLCTGEVNAPVRARRALLAM